MPRRKASSESSYHPDDEEEESDSSYHSNNEIKVREKKCRKVRRKIDIPKSTPKRENQHHKKENQHHKNENQHHKKENQHHKKENRHHKKENRHHKKENQHHKQEISKTPPRFASQDLGDLSKISMDHLKKVTQTAIQFQRHSHSKQLCSKHFSKALIIHGFHFESDFHEDFLDYCTSKKR